MSRLLVAACVAVLGLAGCTSEEPAPPHTTKQPAVDVPKDRGERAVVAALRQTDTCAVLGAASANAGTGETDTLSAPSPSVCEMSVEPSGDVALIVTKLSSDQRLSLPSATFDGAKAYLDLGATAESCDIYFPVSFQLAFLLRVEESSCEYAKKLATGVATTLTDPAWAPAEPRWGACDALRSVPGTDAATLDKNTATLDTMDGCSDMKSLATLDLVYPRSFPSRDAKRTDVGGVDVWVVVDNNPGTQSCSIEWAPEQSELVVRLRAVRCDQVEPLVEPVNRTLRQPPPEVEPQEPLLYQPDEPDRPFAGACAFAENVPNDCAPHVEVPVPAGDDLVRTAGNDPDVACGVALDAVTKHFGEQMEAVVVPSDLDTCFFAEPERLLQLEFSVFSEPVRDVVNRGAGEINVAGHTGYSTPRHANDDRLEGYEFLVATSTNADEPGALRLQIRKGPVARTAPSDEAISKTESVLTDVVREHFG